MLVHILPPVAIRLIYAVLIAINVIAFVVYGVDKKRAHLALFYWLFL